MKLPVTEYVQRRQQLLSMMQEGAVAVLPSAGLKTRNKDTHFAFRQDSDFLYLSGFNEPDAVMVLIPGRAAGEAILFCNEKDPLKELWDGKRLGPEGVVSELQFDDAFPIDDIDEILPGLLEGASRVYYALGKDQAFDASMMEWLNTLKAKARSGATPPGEFVDLDHYLHEMRLIKSKAEIELMQHAATISAEAHCAAMKAGPCSDYEFQLEAEIQAHCVRSGARFQAYTPIVGAGENACILHYTENDQAMSKNDLVLIDAGCELDGYASDITRTFPVGGKFSEEQKALYNVVLEAQYAAIEVARVGNSWDQPHNETVRVITEGLVDLGLLKGDVAQLIEAGAYRDFYMHRAGHWLGLDVHDVGAYKIDDQWRLLEEGMVMTIEPGIYVSPKNENVEERWRGIGIRIEDDVVITRGKPKILTSAVPKTVDDIEALMAQA